MNENKGCVFCAIEAGKPHEGIVALDHQTMTLLDWSPVHQGCLLVMPRNHFEDHHDMDNATGDAVLRAIRRAVQAIGVEFTSEQIDIWKSASQGSNLETQHVHFHVQPRDLADQLRVTRDTPQQTEAIVHRLRRGMTSVRTPDTCSRILDSPLTPTSTDPSYRTGRSGAAPGYPSCGCTY